MKTSDGGWTFDGGTWTAGGLSKAPTLGERLKSAYVKAHDEAEEAWARAKGHWSPELEERASKLDRIAEAAYKEFSDYKAGRGRYSPA